MSKNFPVIRKNYYLTIFTAPILVLILLIIDAQKWETFEYVIKPNLVSLLNYKLFNDFTNEENASLTLEKNHLNNNYENYDNEEIIIQEQINFTKKKYLLDWYGVFDDHHFAYCPNYNCTFVHDRNLIDKVDAVAFNVIYVHFDDLPKSRRPDQYFVFLLLEPPSIIGIVTGNNFSDFRLRSYMNVTITYR